MRLNGFTVGLTTTAEDLTEAVGAVPDPVDRRVKLAPPSAGARITAIILSGMTRCLCFDHSRGGMRFAGRYLGGT